MEQIQKSLLEWFYLNKRPLPWRNDYIPYHVWIAEVMMQQTQMERGVAYYLRWIKKFPTVNSVGYAPEEQLLSAWEGLGYYKRVKHLQAAARAIMDKHNGIFPQDYTDILKLPGIGPYTAGAIASTAFNQPVPCIDGNVERVLTRLFDIDTPTKKEPAKSQIYTLTKQLIPQGLARDFNQALMEFGALLCRKKPLCMICPISQLCKAHANNTQLERPIPMKKSLITKLEMAIGVLQYHEKIFIQRRLHNDIWGGLWEFPGGCIKNDESPDKALLRKWMEELGFFIEILDKITIIPHSYTSYRIKLHCFSIKLNSNNYTSLPTTAPEPLYLSSASTYQWISRNDIRSIPLPSPHRKLATLLFKN